MTQATAVMVTGNVYTGIITGTFPAGIFLQRPDEQPEPLQFSAMVSMTIHPDR